jgi:hypothetical protein
MRGKLAGRSVVRDGLAVAMLMFLVLMWAETFNSRGWGNWGMDFRVCQNAALSWFNGAPLYPAYELAGPYDVTAFGLILYPPITTALFLPTLLLPAVCWWLIPAAILATVTYRLRPSWGWSMAMAYCLAYPNSAGIVMGGNPDMWLAAALALAVYWRPAAAFVLLKPSLAIFAFVGLRSRGWWAVVAIFAVVSLALLPQTLDWLTVVRNGQGGRSGLIYSLYDAPFLAVPLLAWAGSTTLKRSRLMTCPLAGRFHSR